MKAQVREMRKLGFTEYQARTYFNLVQRDFWTASNLAKESGVPRTRVYSVLEELQELGLCVMVPGKIRKYKAVNPKYAFTRMQENIDFEAEKKKRNLKEMTDLLAPIFNKNREGGSSFDYVELINQKSRATERLNELEEKANYEIISMTKPPYIVDYHEIMAQGGLREKSDDVKYRFICQINNETDNDIVEVLKLWHERGADIKVLDYVPIKLMIFDEKNVVMNISEPDDHKNDIRTIVIENEELATFNKKIFDLYYKEAQSFDFFLEQRYKG